MANTGLRPASLVVHEAGQLTESFELLTRASQKVAGEDTVVLLKA